MKEQKYTPLILRRIARIAQNILFPPLCIYCETYLNDRPFPLCEACYASICKHTALLCPVCGTRTATNKRSCGHGKKASITFPYLLGAVSRYDDPIIRRCIHACKYEKLHSMTGVCSRLLIEYVQRLNPMPDIFATKPTVVPIPLHPAKERKRGFNQSALIARSFAHAIGFPYDELLVKVINDKPQAQTKTHTARLERMHGAFAVPCPMQVRHKNIILIDDVSTSGATLSEAARTLKAAGARHIIALVIAKA